MMSEDGSVLLDHDIDGPLEDQDTTTLLPIELAQSRDIVWDLSVSSDLVSDSVDAFGSVTIRDAAVRRWGHNHPAIRTVAPATDRGIVIRPNGKGFASYGPYIKLARGDYQLNVEFNEIDTRFGLIAIEVTADFGRRMLCRTRVKRVASHTGWVAEMPLQCFTDAQNVEFRVKASGRAEGCVRCFVLLRI